ncbi:hypothetical protein [Thalassovita litoralis]|uniref:hypothetical protein n=1 Tax=Thalassovita litoralis TaxID=1010611 RepID=UPI00163D644D|nr:hypothetical protein [Thalassovita litoralis]
MRGYLLVAAFCGLSAALGWVILLQIENSALAMDVAALKGRIALCDARTGNIIEDRKSDATVTDPGNYDVPDRWLLPETGAARD